MKTNFTALLWVFFSWFLLLSCKKSETEEPATIPVGEASVVNKLKTFYEEKQKQFSSDIFTGSRGEPQWSKAKFSAVENIYIVPVNIDILKKNDKFNVQKFLRFTSEADRLSGEYYYIISETGKPTAGIDQAMAKIHFAEANKEKLAVGLPGVIKVSLEGRNRKEAGVNPRVKNNSAEYKEGSKETGTGSKQQEACSGGIIVQVDWYYQEFDQYGNVIYEEYLYSTTECWEGNGGPGGGGGNTPGPETICNANLALAQSTIQASNTLLSWSQGRSEPLKRTMVYAWQYAKAGIGHTLKGIAYDRGVQKRANTTAPWTWESLENIGGTTQGTYTGPSGTSLTISIIHGEAVLGTYNAKMYLLWSATTTATYAGFTTTSHKNNNSVMSYNIDSPPITGF